MNNNKKYKRAKKKVAALKGFYIHLTVYVLVNVLLIIINLVATPKKLWFIFPLLGWGIGISAHFLSLNFKNKWGLAWEDRKIKEYMEKDDRVE